MLGFFLSLFFFLPDDSELRPGFVQWVFSPAGITLSTWKNSRSMRRGKKMLGRKYEKYIQSRRKRLELKYPLNNGIKQGFVFATDGEEGDVSV